jgi:hypothetical protein
MTSLPETNTPVRTQWGLRRALFAYQETRLQFSVYRSRELPLYGFLGRIDGRWLV